MERFRERVKVIDTTLLNLEQLYTILSHVVYFQACEVVFLKGHQRATYLYTLMFYNVMSYCSKYAKEVYERKQWLPYVTITETSQVKHLGMSATKITLEWTKFLIFFLTMVFILLTIIFAQEVQGVHTSIPYLSCTFIFYLIQDDLFIELFTKWPLLTKIEKFECREALYGKLSLKIAAVILSLAAHTSLLIVTHQFKIFLFGIYINVYLRIKDMLYKEITILVQEEESVKKFRTANKSDISKFDDVCAICLGEMKSARETQCHHLFHDHCLSLAIKTSNFCPTCKSLL